MRRLSVEQVKVLMRKKQDGRSLAVFGQEIGVTKAYLCDVYAGKRNLGKSILAYLGLVENPPTYSVIETEVPNEN